jgi:hypothetical protein
MTSATTIQEVTIPVTWDAKLMLEFIENPAAQELNQWIDAELAALETKWQHASSPKAWAGQSIRGSRPSR